MSNVVKANDMYKSVVCKVLFVFIHAAFTLACSGIGQIRPEQKRKPITEDKTMNGLTRQELINRATKYGDPILATLRKPETVVEQIPTDFFSDGAIYRVSTRPPDRPRVYNLGVWGQESIILLNNEPDNYFELAANAGLRLNSGSKVEYVTTLLDVTRDFTGGIQILHNIGDSWWLPSPSPEESRLRDELIGKYTNIVKGPSLSNDTGSTVIVYLIRDRALVKANAKVENDGRIEIKDEVLEPLMPTVMLK